MQTHYFFITGITLDNKSVITTAISNVPGTKILQKDDASENYSLTAFCDHELAHVRSEVTNALAGTGASLSHVFSQDQYM